MDIEKDKTSQSTRQQHIYYFTNCSLFAHPHCQLLCRYKQFIEALIMQLGEDWRIQAALFTEEILVINKQQRQAQGEQQENQNVKHEQQNFSLFNQFLSSFLQGRAYQEYQFSEISENDAQEQFLNQVSQAFLHQEIIESLTFKTLSLGFCITASEIWGKIFKHAPEHILHNTKHLKCFAKLSYSKQTGNSSSPAQSWKGFAVQQLGELEYEKILKSIEKMPHQMSKAQVLSNLICEIGQIRAKGKKIRTFELCNQFYLGAFVVWLIFNIKMFFSLTASDYVKFTKNFIGSSWQPSFVKPLEVFQKVLDKQWNKLLKDYTVALHDDLQVLKMLIERVRTQLEHEWDTKLIMINPIMEQ